ncbi:molybdopterin cofactor-binding domain-containing protein [Variovorax paradoxus]|uniref:xanthine dehydrogenase family protein molybdopterin-binding subunit n=1 Tax=Variovorax paradoxus TaxID=34073 RepID=UPI0024786FD8
MKHDRMPMADTASTHGLTRRAFVATALAAGGGLALTVSLPPLEAKAAGAQPEAFAPNAVVRIGTDGLVTLVMPRVEMGQGIYTAVALLIAEELEIDPRRVRLEHAPADETRYANPLTGGQITGGSTSVRSTWEPMRRAGATARLLLVEAAAHQWKVEASTCRASDGAVEHVPTRRKLAYGQLARAAAGLPVPAEVPLKDLATLKRIGQPLLRLDGPDKVNGRARYGLDASVAGMRIAAIAHCPVIGGRLASVDDARAMAVKGVRQVVRIDNAVAVVADHMGAARKGLAALEIRWDEGANADYSTEKLIAALADASSRSGAVARKEGDTVAAARSAARTVDAVYQQPLLAHAPMEPVNCTVHVRPDACELWVGTQVPARAQAAAAELTGLPIERVEVHNHLLGGGFGRRLDIDFVLQAVKIAKQVNGPVKVVWTREEDTRHSTFRPYHYNRLSAALDARGRPVAWHHRVTASSILARWAPARFQNELDGDAIRDAAGPYGFANVLVEYVREEPPAGITTAFWRGVGHMQNAFPVECFVDELAHLAGSDAIAYRHDLLEKHPRARHVLELVARKSGWGGALPAGKGRGVALTFCFGSYAAQVTEVSVDADGAVRVDRVVIAVDCGRLISPDTVVAQMQGGTAFGLSAVLYGNISIKDGRVEQGNFDTYRVLRMDEMPVIETHLVPSTETPGGVGEVGTVLTAPSVLNAVFAATGKRIRRLPFAAEELKRA